jgi:hypothetical protein
MFSKIIFTIRSLKQLNVCIFLKKIFCPYVLRNIYLPHKLSFFSKWTLILMTHWKKLVRVMSFLPHNQRWPGIKSLFRHSIQKNPKGPQDSSIWPLFWHFVWEIVKATATKVSYYGKPLPIMLLSLQEFIFFHPYYLFIYFFFFVYLFILFKTKSSLYKF